MISGAGHAPPPKAFSHFLEQNYQMLVGYLNKKVGSWDDAQDIAQESATRLMRYSHHPPEVLKPLMFRIALNLVSDSRRRNIGALTISQTDEMDVLVEQLQSDVLSPEAHTQHHQELLLARAAILRLPSHCKQIYLLNRMDGLSYTQIARQYNVSVKAIEKQMSKALTLINRHLASHGAGRNATQ